MEKDAQKIKDTISPLEFDKNDLFLKNQISKVFITVPDDEVYGEVLDLILKSLKCNFGIFGYLNENEDIVEPSLTKEIWVKCNVDNKDIIFPKELWSKNIFGRVIIGKKSIIENKPFVVPEGHLDVTNFLGTPIIFQDTVIGIISVANKKENFLITDARILESIVTYLAPILHARIQRDKEINERYKFELELKESEQKHRSITKQALMGIAIIQDGKVKYINSAMLDINGFTNEEMLNWGVNDFFKFIHPDDLNDVMNRFKDLIEKRIEKAKFECRAFTKSKELKTVQVYMNIINFNNSDAIYLNLIDVTDQKKMEQKLIASEKKAREESFLASLYMDNMPCVALLIRPKTREIVVSNQKAKEVGALPGCNCFSTWGQREDPCPWCLAPKTWTTGETNHVIVDALSIVWDAYWVKINDDLYLHYAFDITEQTKREKNLKELNQMKSEFLKRTSHELKTPLVSIKGFSELLLDLHKDSLNDDSISIVNEIKDGCLRLETLINDILKTSELDSGSVELKKEINDLTPLINICVNEVNGIARLRNQVIKLNIQQEMSTFFEKESIHQVFSNLITNAVKYTPKNGEITIESKIKQGYYYISIIDSGIGFTKEEEKDLFSQFGKIERYGKGMDVMIEGSGLGLYISKKIIEMHDGQIWMESEGRNKGSTFTFTLPIIK